MSANTKIEWCDHTFNPWIGCTKISPACDHCYAAQQDTYRHWTPEGWGGPRKRTSVGNWKMPLRWNAQADAFMAQHGRRQRVFCASLADVFDNAVDPQWRADLFELIRATPNLDWLLLTKRIGNAAAMIQAALANMDIGYSVPFAAWPWPNVWIGATVVNQEEADRDIPKLLAVPARVRFLSMEPLLGPVNLERPRPGPDLDQGGGAKICQPWMIQSGIDWVIVGGESGPSARPMHPDWARSLRDQCEAAGTPFLFKQWGEWHTAAFHQSTGLPVFRQFDSHQQWVNKARTWVQGGICLDRHGRELRNGGDMARARDQDSFPVTIMHRVGKKTAGRLLDGHTWDGFPVP